MTVAWLCEGLSCYRNNRFTKGGNLNLKKMLDHVSNLILFLENCNLHQPAGSLLPNLLLVSDVLTLESHIVFVSKKYVLLSQLSFQK